MQGPGMGAAEAIALEQFVRPAGEVAIGIEQQLDALAKFVLTQEQRVSQRFQIGHNLYIAQRDSCQQARSGYNGFSASRKIMSAVLTYLPHNVTPSPSVWRSEEHTSELQSLMRTSYAVFFLK